ncbi:unnamed protein product, partial [Candidula unifasciata]
IFSDTPGSTSVIKHHIRLTTEIPVKTKPYPIPLHYQKQVEAEISELEKCGIIRRSSSNYSSPLVIVKKKDSTLRICVDYRKKNTITHLDAEPIPNADELIATMCQSQFFSKLDLTKGYWQIPVTEESRHITAYATPTGLFEWCKMPFGLQNSPATFVRMMRIVFKYIKNVATNMDDICIHNANMQDHISSLTQVFKRLREFGLKVKPSKVEIGFTKIDFLGHKIDNGFLQTDDKIISKILDIKAPKTKKQVRSMLGLINYYNKFLPDCACMTAALSSLVKKGLPTKIAWTPQLEQILTNIKTTFSKSPILKLPDLEKPFILQCNASGYSISCILLQEHENILLPVLYSSRKLSEAEKRYTTVELEALSLVVGVTKFAKYLLGRKFIVQTDNKPLTVFKEGTPKNHRIYRWSLLLQNYSFELVHISGINNALADILSRL